MDWQAIFRMQDVTSMEGIIWTDSRTIPLYGVLISQLLLSLHATRARLPSEYLTVKEPTDDFDVSVLRSLEIYAQKMQLLRLVACFSLLALTGYLEYRNGTGAITPVLLTVYTYASALSLCTVFSAEVWRIMSSRHLSFLLLGIFCVYIYRDIVPLATQHESMDEHDGWLAIVRLCLQSVCGLFVPILLPRQYYPIDPEHPQTPSCTQTACWLSAATFSYMDPVIYHAYKQSAATPNDLPSLADSDKSKFLATTAFPFLDPFQLGKGRGLFIGLLLYYKWLILEQFILLAIQVVNDFASPVATLKLLAFLEAEDKKDGLVRPWVWILWLAFGPVIASLCNLRFQNLSTTCHVQIEAILTQLILEHSMRIRINSHTSEASPKDDPQTDPVAPRSSSDVNGEATSVDQSPSKTSEVAALSGENGENGTNGHSDAKPSIISKKLDDQTGKVMTILSSDLKSIQWGQRWLQPFFYLIRIAVCSVFLFNLLGWSALLGIGFLVVTLPVPTVVAKILMSITVEKMKKTDARIQIITQVMNVIRMVKLFAWGSRMEDQIAEKRNTELKYIRRNGLVEAVNGALNSILPLATMMIVYATYTLGMKRPLNASVVFPSAAVFALYRNVVFTAFAHIPYILRAKVSLDRIGEYLNGGIPLENRKLSGSATSNEPKKNLYIREACFTWTEHHQHVETAGSRVFRLKIEGELLFRRGKINLICGPTGCGKTSLLMGLLGEMFINNDNANSIVCLPRDGGISYAAQESWVLSGTIKENILFQTPYEEERYKRVIYQTGLEQDLSLLAAGDLTEVGEKGVTLRYSYTRLGLTAPAHFTTISGGQKARITLARAVYSRAEIVLLDDVLSSLDVHTSKWVAEQCLGGNLLEGRTVLLVTHHLALVESICDFVVWIDANGKVTSHGSFKSADLPVRVDLPQEFATISRKEKEAERDLAVQKPKGNLFVDEEIALGHVSWKAAKLYLTSLGGFFFYISAGPVFVLSTFFPVLQTWFLGYWASQYEIHQIDDVPVKRYILLYGLILLTDIVLESAGQAAFLLASIKASRSIHSRLIHSILSSTFRWLDTVPISRVITRCAQDCQTIDGIFVRWILWMLSETLTLLIAFFAIIVSSGWPSLPPAILVVVAALIFSNLYINAQLPIKRTMSNQKSPIIQQIGNVMAGIISVRAYGAQGAFRDESQRRVDVYTRTALSFFNTSRWIGFRMDTIGGVFSGSVATWLIYGRQMSAGAVGFTLTVLGSFSGTLLNWIRVVNEVEVQANSLERISEYLEIDHEPSPTMKGVPPAHWPVSGQLSVEHLTANYSPLGPVILKDLSFHIKSGERVAVVGRTGAGKSTLALALLRAIPTNGNVVLDGIQTTSINLDSIRSHITIIPQHPELLSGTLRENLDPFMNHDDAELNAALISAGLNTANGKPITLDTDVQSDGSNFSQGQRQIISLARAIVRRSKLLILDEATAAVDHETDEAIQVSLRTEFKGTTVITIAHRLRTIMDYDKIMVLDDGKLTEYDTPKSLLSKQDGLFYRLVEESSDRDDLYQLARV